MKTEKFYLYKHQVGGQFPFLCDKYGKVFFILI